MSNDNLYECITVEELAMYVAGFNHDVGCELIQEIEPKMLEIKSLCEKNELSDAFKKILNFVYTGAYCKALDELL